MGAPLCWCLELGWEAVDSRHEISCVYIRMEKEILPLCNMQCYCDMLGHDLVPKDTPAHILQTQSVACTMPQHCKFLVLLLENWRRLRFMVTVKNISFRWSMKGTEKVLFFSILGRPYYVCLPNWRETSSFTVLCTYNVIEVRWFDFRSEDAVAKILWNENPSWPLLKRSHAESCNRPELGHLEHLSPAHMVHQYHRSARASWSGTTRRQSLWNPLREFVSLQYLTYAGRKQN